MNYISFPGLGIEPFHIDKVAFSVFGRGIAWYALFITTGMILAVLLSLKLIKREGISSDDIIDLAFTVIIFGILGARAYYVIFTWNESGYLVTGGSFFENLLKTLYNCIAIWNGGLAIYGGVIAGLLSAFVFAKIKKIKYFKLTDILAPCCLIGQIIGRWGNFINMEAYGGETDLPWRMGLSYIIDGQVIREKFVHPTFIYESLWNLCVLAVIMLTYRKKKFDGQMLAEYFIGYGFGRMLIEGLRADSLYLGGIRISQLVGCVSIIIGVLMFIIVGGAEKKKQLAGAEYNSVYSAPTDEPDETATDKSANTDEN